MTLKQLKQQKLDQLGDEYRRNGYSVDVHPDPDHLPQFLRGFEPDLLATSPSGNVVVDVKSASALNRGQFTGLAQAIEAQPGWRYEVAFVNQPVAAEMPA